MDDITSLDLIALGEVMLLPEDDLTLAAVLKSPLFGLTEDQLYYLARDRENTETLFARLYQNPAKDDAVAKAYERLLEYMGMAEKFGVHGFYNQVLDMPTWCSIHPATRYAGAGYSGGVSGTGAAL